MAELLLSEVAGVINGQVLNGQADLHFTHYHFDTREIDKNNSLFFALKTDTGDGHGHIKNLPDKPGLAAVVSNSFDTSAVNIPLIIVNDPLKAVHQLAIHVRNKFNHIKYVGITGSAGKTTTKEFVFQLVSNKFKAFRSYSNWNNWIGLPFSLLALTGREEVAVFEMAMSYPGIGEIDLLAEILRPDIALLLNVFPVHLEFLKNIQNVARAKAEILNYLSSDSVAFITGDSSWIVDETRSKIGRKVYFGRKGHPNQIIAKKISRLENGSKILMEFFGIETEFFTDFINQIHIENMIAAIIVVKHLGMKDFEVQKALKKLEPLGNRGKISKYKDFTTVDETYNSNPEAAKKTLLWIDEEFKGKKIAVLGDMLELGKYEAQFHYEVGEYLSRLNYSFLITVGQRAEKIAEGAVAGGFDKQNIKAFTDCLEAGAFIKTIAEPQSTILFKASRGIRLEDAMKEFLGG